MRIAIIGERGIAYDACHDLLTKLGHTVVGEIEGSDVAIAPLLQTKIDRCSASTPRYGTLIFHPSALPYGRGRNAIKASYRKGESISAATWFWASDGLDEGDICEQEIVRIDYRLRPRDFYATCILPAMVRTLGRAVSWLNMGIVRRVPQREENATYD
jgi:methionyl-tRNA formyltransferase